MNQLKAFLLAVVVVSFGFGLTACGSDSDPDTSKENAPNPELKSGGDSVEGVTWQLMNVGSDQGWATSLPNTVEPPTIRIEDGRADVFTGCNNGSGDAEVAEKSIVFGPIATTKKACDETSNQFESLVNQVLTGKVKYEINEDGNLSLKRAGTSLIYIPQ